MDEVIFTTQAVQSHNVAGEVKMWSNRTSTMR
jgi:hypothetical protein